MLDPKRKSYAWSELSDEDAAKLIDNPQWFPNENGFVRRKPLSSLKEMSEESLYMLVDGEDSYMAAAANDELSLRRQIHIAKINHRLDLKKGILLSIFSFIVGYLLKCFF